MHTGQLIDSILFDDSARRDGAAVTLNHIVRNVPKSTAEELFCEGDWGAGVVTAENSRQGLEHIRLKIPDVRVGNYIGYGFSTSKVQSDGPLEAEPKAARSGGQSGSHPGGTSTPAVAAAPFKVGDRVRCITRSARDLVAGQEYDVEAVHYTGTDIRVDGSTPWWFEGRFVLAEPKSAPEQWHSEPPPAAWVYWSRHGGRHSHLIEAGAPAKAAKPLLRWLRGTQVPKSERTGLWHARATYCKDMIGQAHPLGGLDGWELATDWEFLRAAPGVKDGDPFKPSLYEAEV